MTEIERWKVLKFLWFCPTKFATFWANISVYNHAIGPEFDLMDSFFILYKMTFKVFENLKILQNLGIKLESRHRVGHQIPISSALWEIFQIYSSLSAKFEQAKFYHRGVDKIQFDCT